ncbi:MULTISPECIES: hypothetical protein [unclassified Microbacterium]|uniref:hypothetical protein n=1 Tax=unclassified Microbacterium TaxID=2609290 RepID=UPI00044EC388|nr:hypothetical protein [Microbacterium sp. MRS-1]EXJ51472.1 hypothetical protein AS96_09175 [Microbacterium sp. MRS-1]
MGLLDDADALERRRAEEAAAELARAASRKAAWVPEWAPELIALLEERGITPVPVYVTHSLSAETLTYSFRVFGGNLFHRTATSEFWGMAWALEGRRQDSEWGWQTVSILLGQDGSVWSNGSYYPAITAWWVEIVSSGSWAQKFGPYRRSGAGGMIAYPQVAQSHWAGFLELQQSRPETINPSAREDLREWVAVPLVADIVAGAVTTEGRVRRKTDLGRSDSAVTGAPSVSSYTARQRQKILERIDQAKSAEREALEEELRLFDGFTQ